MNGTTTTTMTSLDEFYRHVQKVGLLRTPDHARRWTDGVLRTLGISLDRGTKKALANALPEELADSLTAVFWLLHFRDPQLPALEFQKQAARRSGNTDPTFARYPVLAVFGGVKQMIDDNLQRRVAESLAPEVRALWEQAE